MARPDQELPPEEPQETPGRGLDRRKPSYLEEAFTLLLSPEIEDPTHQLLELVGRELGVSRTYLFRFREGGRRMDNTHEWCAPGVSREIHRLQDLPADAFPWWMEKLRSGEGVVIPDVASLPAEAASERATLSAQGIRAALVLPLLDRIGRLEGFLGFDDVKGTREWAPAEIAALRLICRLGMREVERERATRSIRRLEARLILTERIARIGGWEIDPATGLAWWSQQTFHLLGRDPTRVPLTAEDLVGSLDPLDQPRVRQAINMALHAGEPFRLECRGLSEPSVFELQGELRDIDDNSGVLFGTIQDITARVRLESEVNHSRTIEAVGQLAGQVAHDFNNFLAVILGSSRSLLGQLEPHSPLQSDIAQVQEAAEQGARLVRQLLALGRREPNEIGQLSLTDCLRGSERKLRLLLGERIRLVLDVSGEDPPVRMDRSQFEQILFNVCVNARDAMPRGGTLRLRSGLATIDQARTLPHGQELLEGASYAVLHIEDEGHGMSEAILARIFEPFFSTKAPGKGSGLGLSSVLTLLDQFGGGVEVATTEGVGSRFTLYLPLAEQPETATLPGHRGYIGLRTGSGTRTEHNQEESERPAAASTPAKTILIVESSPGVMRMLRRTFSKQGYHVLWATSCPEARTRIVEDKEGSVDLLLASADLPEDERFALTSRFRELCPDGAVILMTGDPDTPSEQRGENSSREHIVTKPLQVSHLLDLARTLVREQ